VAAAIVERVDPVDEAARAHWLDALDGDGAHAAAVRALPALRQIEVGVAPQGSRTWSGARPSPRSITTRRSSATTTPWR
jgi:hypothetical protein